MIVYVVRGRSGEYSGTHTWPVEAWPAEAQAIERVKFLNEAAGQAWRGWHEGFNEEPYSMLAEIQKKMRAMPDGDPHCYISYTGLEYDYYPVELKGAP